MAVANIFEAIPDDLPEEAFDPIITGRGVRIERIVSRGHTAPATGWLDQDEAEWVMVLAGAARLELEDAGTVELGPGDHLAIAPHRRHRVVWTDPERATVWLAVHFEGEGMGNRES